MDWTKWAILFASLIHTVVFNAQYDYENQSGSWLEFSMDNKIDESWSIPVSSILKHHELFETYDFAFIRTGITHHFKPTFKLTAGIAYLNSQTYTDTELSDKAYQLWIYNQCTITSNIGQNALSHRLRLENRWVTKIQSTHFNHRVRYRMQFSKSIFGKVFVKSFNEIFFNLKGHAFNQNRIFIGIGREISPMIKMDIGYLKNHFRTKGQHAIRMGLTLTTDFTKKEVAHLDK